MIGTSQRAPASSEQHPAKSDESEMVSSGGAMAAPAYYRRHVGESAAGRHVASSPACCSAKIQQKQQEFLAAAARSATSPSSGASDCQRRAPCACNQPAATSVASTPASSTTSISAPSAAATLMASHEQRHKQQQQQQQATTIAGEQQQQREMSTGMEATSAPILIGTSGGSDSADASRQPAQAVAVAAAAAAKAPTTAAVAAPGEQQRQRRPRQQQAGAETAGEAQMSVAEAVSVAVGGGAATGAKEAKGVVAVDGRQASVASQQQPIVQPRYIQFHNFNINNNNNNNNLYHQQQQQHHHTNSFQHHANHNPQPHHHHHHHSHQQHHNHFQHNHGHSQHHQAPHQHQQQQHHHHHHHHHQQRHLNQQQQQQQHNMAHYKFHNDCQSSVLTYEQVKRLDFVMDQTVPIHGRGNYPTLYVKLKELIRLVKHKLQTEHSIEIRDVRLNGGAASYVLAPENSHYNDLDLIFGTDLSDQDQFDVIRDVVLECLKEFLPKDHHHNHQHHHFNPQTPFGPDSGQGSHESLASNGSAASNSDSGGGQTNIDNGANYATTINNNSPTCDSKLADESGVSGQQHQSTTTTMESSNKVTTGEVMVGRCDSADNSLSDKSDNRGESGQSDEEDGKGQKEEEKNAEILVEEKKFETNCTYDNELQVDFVSNSEEDQPSQQQPQDSSRMMPYHHHQPYQMPLSNCAIKEAYVHKMVKVNDDDRWSLISLGVQQSEANFGAVGQAAPTLTVQQQQFPVNLVLDAADSQRFNSSQPANLSNMNVQAQPQQQPTHPYHLHHLHQQQHNHHHLNNQRNHYQQQKQSPNSIELKFVDRMRRKFEFSVDSFQIILDSLIQFYDYAPQSTIASQRKLISSHPSSTMINTRPLQSKKICAGCYVRLTDDNNDSLSKLMNGCDNYNHKNQGQHLNNNNNHQKADCAYSGSNNKQQPCVSLLNSSRSYYQLPLEPSNSPSTSSVASSSGCSSSSSVVSSSSSSLSCDEDHEDLYCDGDSPSSSSASTSSLLSSTTSSLLTSETETLVSRGDLSSKCARNDGLAIKPVAKRQQHQRSCDNNNKDNASTGSSSIVELSSNSNNIESTPPRHAQVPSISAEAGQNHGLDGDSFECFEGLPHHQHNHHNMFDYCDMNGVGTSCAVISENFYPTVIGRSEYGDFKEALYHLEKKLIATRSPEEIRGGGLLKYCNLLVKNYKPTNVYQIRTLERYMCSRFFIDFSDLSQQQAKLESYLANHFSDDPILKFDYLTILHNVVQRSTVCLMNHELRLTLNMIRDLAFKQNEQQQNQQQQLVVHQQPQDQKPIQSVQNQAQQHHHHHQQQQQQQHYYQQQKPVLLQSGVYRVKLVNYTLAKLVRP